MTARTGLLPFCASIAILAGCHHPSVSRKHAAPPTVPLVPLIAPVDGRVKPDRGRWEPSSEQFQHCVIGPSRIPATVLGQAPAGQLWVELVNTGPALNFGFYPSVRVDSLPWTQVDSSGHIHLERLAPGAHTLEGRALGFWPRRDTVHLSPERGLHLRTPLVASPVEGCLWMYKNSAGEPAR
jgi:hypothetical protein